MILLSCWSSRPTSHWADSFKALQPALANKLLWAECVQDVESIYVSMLGKPVLYPIG